MVLRGAQTAHRLLDLVFPGRCPGCGGIGEPLCRTCTAALRAAPLAVPPPGVDLWVSAFAYEGTARELIAGAKYRGRHGGLAWLGNRMVERWHAVAMVVPDIVTWVPTAAPRRRARGVDHARLLGLTVARGLRVPARPLLLRHPGPPQTDRPVEARREGPRVSVRAECDGTVLLVDDVTTTGATLRVCARVLRDAGAHRVVALTAARTASPVGGRVSQR